MSNELVTSGGNALQPQEAGYFTADGFALLQRVASVFERSSVVPKEFKGNLANCIIAVNMALRMRADPLMVIQNLYIVYGVPSFSAKFLVACLNNTGRFSALRYVAVGEQGKDTWGCYATATELKTGEVLQGPTVTIGIAKAEGWYGKSGSKWQTMPELMLRYRAASQFIKLFAPEISMGMQSTEEVYDSFDAEQGQAVTLETVPGAIVDAAATDEAFDAEFRAATAERLQNAPAPKQTKTKAAAEAIIEAANKSKESLL